MWSQLVLNSVLLIFYSNYQYNAVKVILHMLLYHKSQFLVLFIVLFIEGRNCFASNSLAFLLHYIFLFDSCCGQEEHFLFHTKKHGPTFWLLTVSVRTLLPYAWHLRVNALQQAKQIHWVIFQLQKIIELLQSINLSL